MLDPVVFHVTESSLVADVRRAASDLAARVGFDESRTGLVAIAATEAATNLIKHAAGGYIQIRIATTAHGEQIEVLAIDRGPGMVDVEACMRDGVSSAGSSGTGLGAINRMASRFDVYSRPGKGTVMVARIARVADSRTTDHHAPFGVVQVPVRGETICGDSWAVISQDRYTTVMVADGLGHGPLAAEASRAAREIVWTYPDELPVPLLERIHKGLRPTRGAAVSIARIDLDNRVMQYAGLGNIVGLLYSSSGIQRPISVNGTAGHQARRFQEFRYTLAPSRGLMIMHSDGLTANWDFSQHAGLPSHDPAAIAGVLWRDHSRGRDDATVVVAEVHA